MLNNSVRKRDLKYRIPTLEEKKIVCQCIEDEIKRKNVQCIFACMLFVPMLTANVLGYAYIYFNDGKTFAMPLIGPTLIFSVAVLITLAYRWRNWKILDLSCHGMFSVSDCRVTCSEYGTGQHDSISGTVFVETYHGQVCRDGFGVDVDLVREYKESGTLPPLLLVKLEPYGYYKIICPQRHHDPYCISGTTMRKKSDLQGYREPNEIEKKYIFRMLSRENIPQDSFKIFSRLCVLLFSIYMFVLHITACQHGSGTKEDLFFLLLSSTFSWVFFCIMSKESIIRRIILYKIKRGSYHVLEGYPFRFSMTENTGIVFIRTKQGEVCMDEFIISMDQFRKYRNKKVPLLIVCLSEHEYYKVVFPE